MERDDFFAEPQARVLLIIKEQYHLILCLRLRKSIIVIINTYYLNSLLTFMKLSLPTALVDSSLGF